MKPILELAFAKGSLESRFDLLSPAAFSTMWLIKTRGKAAEKRGENTDALWREYWKMFEQAVKQGGRRN